MKDTDESKCVVRVSSESYQRGDTYFIGHTLRVLKGKTTYNLLQDEVDAVGTFEALNRIINLSACQDGVYQLICTNMSRDWESGHIDDWDLKLIPCEE